jgi:hypothetical protein
VVVVGCIRDLGKCIYPGELWRWPSCTLQAQSRVHMSFFCMYNFHVSFMCFILLLCLLFFGEIVSRFTFSFSCV